MARLNTSVSAGLATLCLAAVLGTLAEMPLTAQENLLRAGSFADVSAGNPGTWELRFGHKGGDFPDIRPYWKIAPYADANPERHPHAAQIVKSQRGAGEILLGQRVTLPDPLPALDFAVEYQAFCDNDGRSGIIRLCVFTPAVWDSITDDPAQASEGAADADIFSRTVHNQGDDVTRWTLARVPTAELHAALAGHAGETVVAAVSFMTWHSTAEEWANLDNVWLGPPLPHIQPIAWPSYVFENEPLTLAVEGSSRDDQATFLLSYRHGPEQAWIDIPMEEAGPARYEGTIPAAAAQRPFAARARVASRTEDGLETEVYSMQLTQRPEHPNLFYSKAELQRMREKIDEFDWARRVFESMKKSADTWLTKEFNAEPVSGYWWHHYNCADCGGRLKWEEDKPHEHACTKCGKVWNTDILHGVWWSGMHGMTIRAAETLGLMYQITGTEAYARRAIEFLTWYAEHYAEFPGGDKGGKVVSQTLDECVWLLKAMNAADLAYPMMTDDEARTIEQKLIRAGAMYTRKYRGGIHNIRCWHNACWGSAGYFLGDPELVDFAKNARYGFVDQMEEGVLEDGMWYERSLGYHRYTVSAITYHLKSAMHAGDDLYLMDPVKKLLLFPLRLTFPNMVTPSLNDGGFSRSPISPYPLEYAVAWYDDPIALSAMAKRYSEGVSRAHLIAWQYGEALPEVEAYTPPPSMDLRGAGLAVLRHGQGDNAICAMVEYGEHGGGHGHPDKLQLILYGLGKQLCPDLGTVGYANPLHSRYYKTTPAHNTVTIGGRNMAGRSGTLLDFLAEDAYSAATVITDQMYENTTLMRRVLLTEGLVVDEFVVQGDDDAPRDWFLRSDGTLELSVDTAPVQEEAPSAPYGYMKDLQTGTTEGQWTATWSYGDAAEDGQPDRLMVTMRGAPRTEVGQCRAPGAAGSGDLWPTLRIRRRQPSTRFLAVHQMIPAGEAAPPVAFEGRTVRVGDVVVDLGDDDQQAPRMR